jgi:hypothetical protein
MSVDAGGNVVQQVASTSIWKPGIVDITVVWSRCQRWAHISAETYAPSYHHDHDHNGDVHNSRLPDGSGCNLLYHVAACIHRHAYVHHRTTL